MASLPLWAPDPALDGGPTPAPSSSAAQSGTVAPVLPIAAAPPPSKRERSDSFPGEQPAPDELPPVCARFIVSMSVFPFGASSGNCWWYLRQLQ